MLFDTIKHSVYVFVQAVFVCSSIARKAHEPLNVVMSYLPRL